MRERTVSMFTNLKTIQTAAISLLTFVSCDAQTPPQPTAMQRAQSDEVVYFVLPDRFENGTSANDHGGLQPGRLTSGFDPRDNGFYHGGDLAGLTARLDYLEELGVTAIWLSPIFENRAVQGPAGLESAGYHGYWITNFLNVDPHLGTREDFREFVEAAHARDMKVYMDIITNHTADVIQMEECHGIAAPVEYRDHGLCPYRSIADFPYTTVGGIHGAEINRGFMGDRQPFQTEENFDRLTSFNFAYTPFLEPGDEDVKFPTWLNDVALYHNRGDSFWHGESALHGDFAGLDDLMTENPAVLRGMIEIYQQWISDFRIDGYRIDTAKHVNSEFWQSFIPAILEHAENEGLEHFHIFGEAYEFSPAHLARFNRIDGFPSLLDFGFQGAARDFLLSENGNGEDLARFFEADIAYEGAQVTSRTFPTFLGNHDMGRIGGFIVQGATTENNEAHLRLSQLAHSLMFFSRGVPTVYYGDEQGFVSDGGDRAARENMFPSLVPDYIDNTLLGTSSSTAEDNFDTRHPLFQHISMLAQIRRAYPELRRGEQVTRYFDHEDPIIAFSRITPEHDGEILASFNATSSDVTINISVDVRAASWDAILGSCPSTVQVLGSYQLTIPAYSAIACKTEYIGEHQ